MVFVFNFLYDFGCKIKISKKKKSLTINCDLLTQMEGIEISISKDV